MSAPVPHEYLRADTEAVRALPRPEDELRGPSAEPAPERLVCVAGVDLGRTFSLDAATTLLGRAEGGIELRATDVSRRHARLSRSRGSVVLEDLGSSNGTYVNGVQLRAPVTLHVGDRIQVGTTTLVFTRHDELEDRAQQAQKLEAMSSLVKGLAHDFNNMLMVLMGGLDELSERLPRSDADAKRTLDDMTRATSSAASLVRRMLRIGRMKPPTSELVRLLDLVDEVLSTSRRLKLEGVRLHADVSSHLVVHGSYEELKQVFLNLVLNARDAMPSGGEIAITASVSKLERAEALSLHLEAEGTYIDISVSDSGTGIDEATLARIFEPFFTTKPIGKGSGLGLAMVYSTIRNHGGAIYAESTLGRGTTFRLLLPAG